MIRLGLHMSVRGGREALLRLVAVAVSIAVGVTILLGLFAEYHGFQAASRTPSWSSTRASVGGHHHRNDELLWNYSQTVYHGRFISQLDIAPLGPDAPHIPGLVTLPPPGRYVASPALIHLAKSAPADELADRFRGALSGVLSSDALSGPQTLAIVTGYAPSVLARMPGTITVDTVSTAAQLNGTTGVYRLAFGAGAVALLFPLIMLISAAARLSTARREQRYAAMRLVGATTRQVAVLASVEATVAAVAGTILGCLLFLAVRPTIADISLSGNRFFAQNVTDTGRDYLLVLLAIPAIATITSLTALRRVRISPFGVVRRVTPLPPKPRSVLPLLAGLGLVLAVLLPAHPPVSHGPDTTAAPTFNLPLTLLGFLLIMIGLVTGGPWLTRQAARLLTRMSSGPASLLAGRRLTDSPASAFRAISGLILAVFVATTIAVIAATVNTTQTSTPADKQLAGVLRMQVAAGPLGPPPVHPVSGTAPPAAPNGLTPAHTAALLRQLRSYPGVTAIPVYALPAPTGPLDVDQNDSVIECTSLAVVAAIGRCPHGAVEVEMNASSLNTDNPLYLNKVLPLVGDKATTTDLDVHRLALGTLLVRTPDRATLERVRTYLTTDAALAATGAVPETFGESAAIRAEDIANVQRVVLAAVLLTLLVASCSLAVTIGAGLLERKRPFTLLRLCGTSLATLRRVVLLESALPLVAGALIAAAAGLGIAAPFTRALLPATAHTTAPDGLFYVATGAGILTALAVVAAALPLLARTSDPDQGRFE